MKWCSAIIFKIYAIPIITAKRSKFFDFDSKIGWDPSLPSSIKIAGISSTFKQALALAIIKPHKAMLRPELTWL